MSDCIPKWHKELEIFSKIKPLLIIEGNVLDRYRYPIAGSIPVGTTPRLPEYLHYYFKDNGYQNIVFFDSLHGFYNNAENGYIENFANLVKKSVENKTIKADFKGKNGATEIVRAALTQAEQPTAIIMNLASRYIPSPDNLEQIEVDAFTALLLASLDSKDVRTEQFGSLKNVLIMIVNKLNDIPVWFYHDNHNVKTISVSTLTEEERKAFIKERFPSFFANDIYREDNEYFSKHPKEVEDIQERFVALTDGFGLTELNGLRNLCKNERIHIRKMCDVIDLYKYGIKDNPWNMLDIEKLKNANEDFENRVKGQNYAITKTLDVVKRAVTGMSGLQHSSHTKPKGVLFFAGPTGTGKTETAKTLAELLFGHENRCIRFDMSEYSQSHADQKLLGAPPGYVGYEAGGQLTNAVKENPFSILLFDEIEKAHPSILDKFLQILEDGRMTDGQGNTVYFSESIIIFTSNLGISVEDPERNTRIEIVNPQMPYSEIQRKVRGAIEEHFKLKMGRPEILNRIGENIVVFDYIRKDVAELILDAQINKIIKNLASEKRIKLTLSENAKATLLKEALENLENGGRGIGNIVESMFINPFSRYLFDNQIQDGAIISLDEIDVNANPVCVICSEG